MNVKNKNFKDHIFYALYKHLHSIADDESGGFGEFDKTIRLLAEGIRGMLAADRVTLERMVKGE